VALNARRAKQTVAQFGHQGHRGIDVEATIGHRAGDAGGILRRKVA
jgi:hypothetical protein